MKVCVVFKDRYLIKSSMIVYNHYVLLRKTGILGESKMELRDFLAFNRLKLFLIPSSLSGNCKFRCCSKVILGTSLLLVNIKNLLKSLNVNPKLFSAVTFLFSVIQCITLSRNQSYENLIKINNWPHHWIKSLIWIFGKKLKK